MGAQCVLSFVVFGSEENTHFQTKVFSCLVWIFIICSVTEKTIAILMAKENWQHIRSFVNDLMSINPIQCERFFHPMQEVG